MHTSHGWHLAASSDTLSKKQRLRASGATPQTEGSGGKIHLHVDCQGAPSFGNEVAGAKVHDSRLIGVPLENSRKMGGCFFLGGLMYAIFVWIRAMITRKAVKKSILERFTLETGVTRGGGTAPPGQK